MASKKTSAQPLHTSTARAEDLKILGYVEAVNPAQALKKARKLFDAATVEVRDTHASNGQAPPADEPATKSKKRKPAKAKKAQKTQPPAESAEAKGAATAPATTGVGKPKRRQARERGQAPEKKLSALDAAALVLAEAGTPLTCQQMIAAMADKGYWQSPKGRTPAATLYSGILREMTTKGATARFRKTDRGQFARTEA